MGEGVTMFKKGDIAARVTTTLTHYGFGSGRAPTQHHSIEIVQVESATKEGRVKKYRTYPGSPAYVQHDRSGRSRFLIIAGENQPAARALFMGANGSADLTFDDQEKAKEAIRAMA